MADQRRGKRKSPCADFIEVNELDLSPENSISDTIEPDAKIPKTSNNGLSLTTSVSEDIVPNLESEIINKPGQEIIRVEDIDKPDSKEILTEVDTKSASPPPHSDIVVKFSNAEIASLFKSRFRKFLESFVELKLVKSDDDLTLSANRDELLKGDESVAVDTASESQKILEPLVPEAKDKDKSASPGKKHKKKAKAKKELFIVDTNPSLRTHGTELQYSSKFVIEDKTEATGLIQKRGPQQQTCFNCGQNHPLRDCPIPRDYAKIRSARQKFAEKTPNRSARYHLEEDQKYSHLKPGKISEDLRKGLGLREHELPPYIYRMRVLGYPPGWLEEAKFIHSNLDMFDIHGNNVRQSLKKKQGLDPQLIVDYPGFNVPLEKGCKDDYKMFGVQPYSRQFSKEIMLDYFEKEFAKNQDDFETCDMDVDDNDDNENAPNTKNNSEADSEQRDSKYNVKPAKAKENPPSPSLIDLEETKKVLLAQLDDSTSSKPGTPCTEEASEGKVTEKTIVTGIYLASDEHSQSNSENEVCNSTKCDADTSVCLNSSLNVVKQTAFGTPILKSSSPYSRLPNPDNFMKDVSPVINFENLPNSTGKYEQMSGVIQKVRNTIKHFQKSKT